MMSPVNESAESADEKLWRIKQVRAALAEYEKKQFPLDPDEVDHFVYLCEEWAGLANIWSTLSTEDKEAQWATSVFPPLLRAARSELQRIAKGLADILDSLAEEGPSPLLARKRERIKARIALLEAAKEGNDDDSTWLRAIASGNNIPDDIWARIIITALEAKNFPGCLDSHRRLEFRADMLLAIAEINRAMFLAVRWQLPSGLAIEEQRAHAAISGGESRRVSAEDEDTWMQEARRLHVTHPEWKGTDVAREVARITGGAFNTIRKRDWLKELMKSDPSAG
jgi:hypothetical protein